MISSVFHGNIDEYNNPPSAVQEADRFLVSDFCNDYLGGAVFREDNYDRAMKEKPINKFHAEGKAGVYICSFIYIIYKVIAGDLMPVSIYQHRLDT